MLNLARAFPATPSPFRPGVLRHAASKLKGEGFAATWASADRQLQILVPTSPVDAAMWLLSSSRAPASRAGVLVSLIVPWRTGPARAAWLANALNLAEAADWHGEHRPHAFGAWRPQEGVLVHTAFFPAVLFANADRDDAVLMVRNLVAWGVNRARFATERLPWLDGAARSRYPDDEPAEETPAQDGDAGETAGEPASMPDETAVEADEVPLRERSFGPASRTPRPPSSTPGPRTHAPRAS